MVSKRFVKQQQMRWTEAGAHLLLQIRAQVLDGDWRATLSRWHPVVKVAPATKPAFSLRFAPLALDSPRRGLLMGD